MSSYLGKAVPLDIHGGHVLVDEEKAMEMASNYGVLRYAFLAAAVRAKQGGRWRYDFTTMNATLALGVGVGFATLSFGRKKLNFMRRRPVGSIVFSLAACLATTVIARQVIKGLGMGVIQAQNSHKKALSLLQCVDCLDDVNDYTKNQIEELRAQRIPQQPGMPPPPEEYVKKFYKTVEMQCKLLETDIEEVRLIKRHTHHKLCEVHKGLRDDADHYVPSSGLRLLKKDRERAKERPAIEPPPQ
ncbi:hypothetical protein AGDE_10829 [Angomonas deanei]|uniref:Uncharacterized protein n=1 Tax=Angomonas deanei TaxID=59799 RepID=A0A7G2C4M4_9TRYP|nr:hypothetical protein AGDE_10829 [Angomonas deanei]CAD2212842.1 hypothetical protein, conserved [Angomonas deanei]|eukprot:EPY27311.1 hypothetical protein AGDE_10829 [Angomonas deanei]